MKYGLQMYTLRDKTEHAMVETLEAVAAMGYTGVELAGFGNADVETIVRTVEKNNVSVISLHVGYQDLDADPEKWAEIAKMLGTSRLTVPWMDPERLDAENIGETAVLLNRIADRLNAAGIELSYHNHDFEFVGGRYAELMRLCPLLKFELDTYWVKFSGFDPVAVMQQYADRIVLVHLKDMLDKTPVTHEDPNPVLMTGTVDVPSILKQAESMGIEWGIVEMDRPIGDSLTAVQESLKNLTV